MYQPVILASRDCATNLAYEEALLAAPWQHDGYLLLWQNDPVVVIGKHQIARSEANFDWLAAHGIGLVRRLSGGGAVYHDCGCLNFSFLSRLGPRQAFADALARIRESLALPGIDVQQSGRNDLLCNGRKISGFALYWSGKRTLAHGTLLVSANLANLCAALTPSQAKLRGVASVRSRVANLQDFMPGPGIAQVREAIIRQTGMKPVSPPELPQAASLARRYRDASWNLGFGKIFRQQRRARFDFGELILNYNLEDGRICECELAGDFIAAGNLEELAGRFIGLDEAAALLLFENSGDYFFQNKQGGKDGRRS